jgi:regulator of sirC expression with transglutaminase-like and TPR domain
MSKVARRASINLEGVGLPGHYVVGHFGQTRPLLIDPFGGGNQLEIAEANRAEERLAETLAQSRIATARDKRVKERAATIQPSGRSGV